MSISQKTQASQPRKFQEITHWDIDTEVAIVGYGGAGACAAIEASDAGAKVAIFELASASGGSTALSSAEIYMGGNGGTEIQKACGFNDNTEDMINYLMMACGPHADENKVRAYCEGSQDHFNWLVSQGVPYKKSFHEERAIMALTDDCLLYTGSEKAWPFNEKAKPCPRGHNLQIEGDNGGPLLMKILSEQVTKRPIDIHCETRALTLIVDEANTVQGVVIRKDRQELNVRARKGVVLCAGGFVMNEEMLKKHAPGLQLNGNYPIGNPGDTGSGILMGMGVGASTIHMSEGFISQPFYPPASMTYSVLVNSQAQRFINEDCYHGRIGHFITQQLGERIYLIVSANEYQRPVFLNADIAGTGETIEELAEELDLNADMLAHTIGFYNKHAANQQDPLFHKAPEWLKPLEPPYAALDCTPGRGAIIPYFTFGGLETLPSGEVLTAEGQVIAGLYAAGRTSCGLPRWGGGYSSGMSVGDATFFGRMAGKQVARIASRN
jgi:succinate dehydrogenase/fumarate reductase flavoprotein subunit